MLWSVAKNKKVVENIVISFYEYFCHKCIYCTQENYRGYDSPRLQTVFSQWTVRKKWGQLIPNPSPGRPPRSSVHEEHCLVPLTSDHLTKKSSKATFGRKNCKLGSILVKKKQKTPWRCRTYDIPLCLQLDQNCFKKWHAAECDKFQNWFFWF